MRVAEVGREMQEKLRGASVCVRGSDLAAQVEALYLAGAGVGRICVDAPIQEQIQNINSQVSIGKNESTSAREIDERVRTLEGGPAAVASGALAALARMKEIFATL